MAKDQKADHLRLSLQSKRSVNTSIGAKEVREGEEIVKERDKRNCSGSCYSRAGGEVGELCHLVLMTEYFLAELFDNGML